MCHIQNIKSEKKKTTTKKEVHCPAYGTGTGLSCPLPAVRWKNRPWSPLCTGWGWGGWSQGRGCSWRGGNMNTPGKGWHLDCLLPFTPTLTKYLQKQPSPRPGPKAGTSTAYSPSLPLPRNTSKSSPLLAQGHPPDSS